MLDLNALDVDSAHRAALQLQSEKKLVEAREIYEKVLHRQPEHAPSLTMMGSICYQQGEDLLADAYIDRSIAVHRKLVDRPVEGNAWRISLMNILMARGHIEEAESLAGQLNFPINPIRATPEQYHQRLDAARAKGVPLVLINTVPKTASESIWNALANGLGAAQGHLSVCVFPDCCLLPCRMEQARGGGLVVKEHLMASAHNRRVLAEFGVDKMVFHLRDPRQVALSWAHFAKDDVAMRMLGPIWRRVVPPATVLKADFSVLLDWTIANFLPIIVDFITGWMAPEAAGEGGENGPARPAIKAMTFERFVDDPEGYYDEVLAFLEIDKELFQVDPSAEVVHLRKGAKEEWREIMSKAQQEAAWALIPQGLADQFGWKQ